METGDGNKSSLLRDLTGLQDPRSIASFLEVAFDAVVTFDLQERITSWNPAAEKMYGWTLQEALGRMPAELFWPLNTPQQQQDKKQRQARLKQGEILQGELFPCRKDGSSFPVQYTARAIFDSDGKISGYLAVYSDISDQLQAREKKEHLQQINHRLNQILASIQDDFYVLNREWVFVFVSRTFTSRIGKEPEDFVGNNIWEMFPKHVGTIYEENLRAAMENRQVRRFEIPGKYTNAWYRMNVFPSEEGITVIGTDISERRRTEQALRESEERFSKAFHASPVGINIFRIADGRSIDVNDAFLALTGYSRQEFIGRTAEELGLFVGSEERAVWIQELHEQDTIRDLDIQIRHKSGNILNTLFSIVRIDLNGDACGLIMALDITARKQAEDALRESEKQLQLLNETLEQKVQEKTEEVRRLAAELVIAVQRERLRISHILHDDLQQRIYAVQMQLTFLHHELEKVNETAHKEIADIEKQLTDVLELTRNLSIDLSPPILRDEGLSQAISWLAGQMRQRYGLLIELQAEEPFAIPNEELHVFLFSCVRELLFNVVKHSEASRAVVAMQWSGADLQIEVCDNGKGFPVKSSAQELSEEPGGEDGIQPSFGLPTLHHQLSLFGGHMEIRSEPGAGTQVILTIPVTEHG